MNKTALKNVVRTLVRELHAYALGEQPRFEGLSGWLNRLN